MSFRAIKLMVHAYTHTVSHATIDAMAVHKMVFVFGFANIHFVFLSEKKIGFLRP